MFLPVGWDNGRVAIPAGAVDVPNMGALTSELAKYVGGGSLAGQSVDLYLSGALYGAIGIRNYNCTDGGTGLRLYGRQNGTTVVRFGASGSMPESQSCCLKVASASGSRQTNRRISIYNLDFDGVGSPQTSNGAIWGTNFGSSFGSDNNRGDIFEIHIQGCRIRNVRQSGVKLDGDGGSDGATIRLCTVQGTGFQHVAGTSSDGFGEGIYLGDGSTGRGWNNFTVEQCHVFNTVQGEAIELKRAGGGVGAIRHCLVHDIEIHSGGALKTEDDSFSAYEVIGNRAFNVTSTGDSAHEGIGLFMTGGGTVENNIIWGCERSCLTFSLALDSNVSSVLRHNTLIAGSGSVCYDFTGNFGNGNRVHRWSVDNEFDVTSGPLVSNQWGEADLTSRFNASFIGPTNGSADNGGGPGSGFALAPGANAAVDVANGSQIGVDITGVTRTGIPDAGALERDVVVDTTPPVVTFTAPNAGQVFDQAATVEISGTAVDASGISNFGLLISRGFEPSIQYWDGASWQGLPTVVPVPVAGDGSFSYLLSLSSSTTYRVGFEVADNAGNGDAAAVVRSWSAEVRSFDVLDPTSGAVVPLEYTAAGNCPFATERVQVRITNNDGNRVLTDGNVFVLDTDSEAHWLEAVVVNGGWSYGSFTHDNAGADYTIDKRRV